MIASFARGMASAVSAIFRVLTAVARAISNLLRGRSPPKLLPNLDWWGTQAMQSYLDGWLAADFGMFTELASTMASYIRALSAKIPQTDIIPRILGTRTAIAALIAEVRKTGEVTEAAMNKVFKAAGLASGSLKSYVKALVEFTAISAKMEELEKIFDFDFAKKIPTKIFGEVINNIDDMRKAANKFTGELRTRILAYVDAMYKLNDANKLVENTQKQINDAAEKYVKILADLHRQLVKVTDFEDEESRIRAINQAIGTGLLTQEEKRRLELELQEIQLRRNIRATEEERDVTISALEEKLKLQEEARDALEEETELQLALAKELATEQLAAAKEQLDAAKALVDIQIENNRLMSEQIELLKRLAEQAAAAAGAADVEMPDFGVGFEGLGTDLEDAIEDATAGLQNAINLLQRDLQTQINEFIGEITKPFETLGPEMRAAWDSAVLLFEDIKTSVKEFSESEEFGLIKDAFTRFGEAISTGIQNIRIFWEQNAPGFLEIVQDFFKRLQEALGIEPGEMGQVAFGLLLTALEGVGNAIVTFTELLIEKGPAMKEALATFVDWIFDTALPKLQEFIGWLSADGGANLKKFAAIFATVAGVLFVGSKIFSLVASIIGFLNVSNIPLLLPFLQTIGKAFIAAGGGAGVLSSAVSIITGLLSALAPVIAIIAGIVAVVAIAFIAWKKNIAGFRDVMIAVWNSIVKTLTPAIEELQKSWKTMQPAIDKAKKAMIPIIKVIKILAGILLTGLVVVLRTVITAIASLVTGLISGLAKGLSYFLQFASVIIEGMSHLIEGLTKFFTGLWDVIVGLLTADFGKVLQGLGSMAEGIILVFTGLIQSAIGILGAGLALILGFVEGFVRGFVGFFVNLYHELVGGSIIQDMLADMITAFTDFFVESLALLGDWIKDIVDDLLQLGKDLKEKAVKAWEEFRKGMAEKLVQILAGVSLFLADKLVLIVNKYTELKEKAIELWENFKKGMAEKIIQILADVVSFLADMLVLIVNRYEEIKANAIELWQNFLDGVREKFFGEDGIIAKIIDWLQKVIDTIATFYEDFLQAGKDIIAGLIKGLWAKAGDLYKAVKQIIKNAIGTGNKESETESPSGVF
ncbi:MAG: hypothetical protein KAR20_00685, partial [Candidatus Heimdallarchaeota archaeon]|nr:hypothetical protein [Candidatus Heimdallarchaeota archaeon]